MFRFWHARNFGIRRRFALPGNLVKASAILMATAVIVNCNQYFEYFYQLVAWLFPQ